MAKSGSATLRGRFQPGSEVRLVKVGGPHVLRPGPNDETVDTQTVDDDGCVSFSKGVTVGDRYFAVGYINGQPAEVRLTGRTSDEDAGSALAGYDPSGLRDRVRLSDGSWLDEAPEQHQKPAVEGATWKGQHQVPKGTLQRSDTPRGTAVVISEEELERAGRAHRKQEPTEPIVEAAEEVQMEPESAPARTSKPAAKSPATTTGKGK
jgi:hypothetical protein